MPYYDEVFKHITGAFPYALAALALNTSEVEVGDPLSTDQATVRMHHSDMTFHIRLPDEEAILHIEAQTDDPTHRPMPLRMLAYSSFLALEHQKNVYSTVLSAHLLDAETPASTSMATRSGAGVGSSIMSSGCMNWKARRS